MTTSNQLLPVEMGKFKVADFPLVVIYSDKLAQAFSTLGLYIENETLDEDLRENEGMQFFFMVPDDTEVPTLGELRAQLYDKAVMARHQVADNVGLDEEQLNEIGFLVDALMVDDTGSRRRLKMMFTVK